MFCLCYIQAFCLCVTYRRVLSVCYIKMCYECLLHEAMFCVTEAKDVKLRKKQIKQQLRHEDELSAALAVWRNEILPGWETT